MSATTTTADTRRAILGQAANRIDTARQSAALAVPDLETAAARLFGRGVGTTKLDRAREKVLEARSALAQADALVREVAEVGEGRHEQAEPGRHELGGEG